MAIAIMREGAPLPPRLLGRTARPGHNQRGLARALLLQSRASARKKGTARKKGNPKVRSLKKRHTAPARGQALTMAASMMIVLICMAHIERSHNYEVITLDLRMSLGRICRICDYAGMDACMTGRSKTAK